MKLLIIIILSCLCVYSTKSQEEDDQNVKNLFQLLNIDRSDSNGLEKAQKAFKENYSWTRFILCGPFNEDNTNAIEEHEQGKFVTLKNLNVIREVLTNFGGMVKYIELSFEEISATDAKQIAKQINVLHQTVETLDLKYCKGDILNELSNAFKGVSKLAFSTSPGDSKLQIGSRKLSEIFPNIKSLDVGYMRASDWAVIDETHSNLEEFTVDLPKREGENGDETQIAGFFRRNVQISKLIIKHASLRLLNQVNEILPNLKTLRLNGLSQNYLNYEGELVHLHNIKCLEIESEHDDEIPSRAVFHRLNQFHLTTKRNFTDKWIEYLDDHVNPNLSQIHIDSEQLPAKYLLEIPERYANLFLVGIKTQSKFVAEDILRYLKRNKRTFRIDLELQMDGVEEKRLQSRVSRAWSLHFFPSGSSVSITIFRMSDSSLLHKLNLIELLMKTNSDPKLSLDDARELFKSNFSHFGFIFDGPLTDDDGYVIKTLTNTSIPYYFIDHLSTIQSFLDNFGSVVQWIMIDFRLMSPEEGRQIVDYVNDKCAQTLRFLYLRGCKGEVLDGISIAFENVEEVSFSSNSTHTLTLPSDRKLNRIFPNIRSLFIEKTVVSDWTFIDGHLPGLKNLFVTLPQLKDENEIDESQITNFFKSNNQVEYLTITNTSLKLLSEANKILPKLTNLTLIHLSNDYSNYQGAPINFATVKHLKLTPSHAEDIPDNTMFDRLEGLTLNLTQNHFNDKWLQFVANQVNANLTVLFLDAADLIKEQFLAIAEQMPNLETVHISCDSRFVANDIVDFIKKSKSLNEIELTIQMADTETDRLRSILSGRWGMKEQTQIADKVKIILKRETVNEGNSGTSISIHQMSVFILTLASVNLSLI